MTETNTPKPLTGKGSRKPYRGAARYVSRHSTFKMPAELFDRILREQGKNRSAYLNKILLEYFELIGDPVEVAKVPPSKRALEMRAKRAAKG